PVFYNHDAYFSRSATVFNHGHFGAYNRGVFEHEGRGVPSNFHPAAAGAREGFARGPAGERPGFERSGAERNGAERPGFNRPAAAAARPEGRGGDFSSRPLAH